MDLAAYFATRDTSLDATAPMPIQVPGALRVDLPAYFQSRGYRRGAEVGVFHGEFAELLCREIPGLRLYAVDCYAQYPQLRGRRMATVSEADYAVARERLAPYDVTFLRLFSHEAAQRVPDGSLDFVYIDANHAFEWVVADIAAWLPKIRPGGIIAGHDYREQSRFHDNRVHIAVQAWTQAYHVRPWFLLSRRRYARGERGERLKTWLWEVA